MHVRMASREQICNRYLRSPWNIERLIFVIFKRGMDEQRGGSTLFCLPDKLVDIVPKTVFYALDGCWVTFYKNLK